MEREVARKIESVSEVAESIQHLRTDFMKRLEEICKKVGVSHDFLVWVQLQPFSPPTTDWSSAIGETIGILP